MDINIIGTAAEFPDLAELLDPRGLGQPSVWTSAKVMLMDRQDTRPKRDNQATDLCIACKSDRTAAPEESDLWES